MYIYMYMYAFPFSCAIFCEFDLELSCGLGQAMTLKNQHHTSLGHIQCILVSSKRLMASDYKLFASVHTHVLQHVHCRIGEIYMYMYMCM